MIIYIYINKYNKIKNLIIYIYICILIDLYIVVGIVIKVLVQK